MTASAVLLPTTYQFPPEWNNRYSAYDANTLEFSAAPPLAVGSVFIVNNQAYRATSVSNSAPYLVRVERPTLPEVYQSLVLNGEWNGGDLAEPPAVTAAQNREQLQADGFKREIAREGEYQGYKASGTLTVPPGLELRGELFAGSKLVFNNWNAISGDGSMEMRVAVRAEEALGLQVSPDGLEEVDGPNDFCGAPVTTRNRAKLFELRPSNPIPTSFGPIWFSVPVCVSVAGKSELRGDILKLASSTEYKVEARDRTVVLTPIGGATTGEMPRSDATFDTPLTFSQGASIELKLEFRAEASLQVEASGIFFVTVQAQGAVYGEATARVVNQARVQSINAALEAYSMCLKRELGFLYRVGAYVHTIVGSPWQIPVGITGKWPLLDENLHGGCALVPSIEPSQLELVPMRPGDWATLQAFGTHLEGIKAPFPQAIAAWKSEDPSIAMVDENGKVTAVGPGTTAIVLSNVLSGVTARVNINVQIGQPAEPFFCTPPTGSPGASTLTCFKDAARTLVDYRASLLGTPARFEYSHSSYWDWASRLVQDAVLVTVVAGETTAILKSTYDLAGKLLQFGEIRGDGTGIRTQENLVYHPNGVLWKHQKSYCQLNSTTQFARKEETVTNEDRSLAGYTQSLMPVSECPTVASVEAINPIDYRESLLYRNLVPSTP